jgi:hypothetical protein
MIYLFIYLLCFLCHNNDNKSVFIYIFVFFNPFFIYKETQRLD